MASQGLLATGTDGHALADPSLFDSSASLREAAAARVAAHRSRRAGTQAMEAARAEALRLEHAQLERTQLERDTRRGVRSVRDAVRARYENSQSYRDFLAAEAERATQHARAEAEIAVRNARAIADAQLQLLEELRQQDSIDRHHERSEAESKADAERSCSLGCKDFETVRATSTAPTVFHLEPRTGDLFTEPEITEITTGGLTVRLYDDLGPTAPWTPGITAAPRIFIDDPTELEELDDEIAFRRAPEFIDHIIETLPLPANLIEFPRELIAARKARPRLAEGPLREELAPEPQLRIFEVEPETISTEPAIANDIAELASDAPVWQGLLLDAPHTTVAQPRPHAAITAHLADIASIPRRLMAATVDACCISTALVGFATIVAWISGPRLQALSHTAARPMLAAAVIATFAISALIYQLLFFSLNEATPGMRYAHIALCTFAETYPSRRAMRRRVLATVLATCPFGLGLLWACMDDDRLGWHDRISRMYHRSY